MISPTGKGIRIDSSGSGYYGASRGGRRHNGVDFLCDAGQIVSAPFNMEIVRISKPYHDSDLSGIVWKSGASTGKIFYFLPFEELIGLYVMEGQAIGSAQSVAEYYRTDEMSDHIHFQVDR